MTAGTFEFDTTGFVSICREPEGNAIPYRWPDLPNDFARGYIRAALSGLQVPALSDDYGPTHYRLAAFSDLHPDTLGSMLADCEKTDFAVNGRRDESAGRLFWKWRQMGRGREFRPLTLSLDPNGKVIAEHG